MIRYPKRTLVGIALGAGLVLTAACGQAAPQETQPPTETKPAASPAAKTAASPVPASPSPAASPSPSPSPVTEIPFEEPERLTALVGRPVRLTNVEVQLVLGDTALLVGPTETNSLIVYLGEAQAPQQVSEGDAVDIRGELRRMPSVQELQQRFNLPEEALGAITDESVYIHAEDVEPAG